MNGWNKCWITQKTHTFRVAYKRNIGYIITFIANTSLWFAYTWIYFRCVHSLHQYHNRPRVWERERKVFIVTVWVIVVIHMRFHQCILWWYRIDQFKIKFDKWSTFKLPTGPSYIEDFLDMDQHYSFIFFHHLINKTEAHTHATW